MNSQMIPGYYDGGNPRQDNNMFMSPSNLRDIGSKYNLTVDELIDWIRSFPYQDCQNIIVLNDLQNGVVFCELVHDILYNRQKPDFIARVIRQNTPSASLINMTTSLNAIKDSSFDIPSKIFSMQPSQLCEENELKIRVLQYLYMMQQRKGDGTSNQQAQQASTEQQGYEQIKKHYQNLPIPAVNNYMNNNSSTKFITPRTNNVDDNQHHQNMNSYNQGSANQQQQQQLQQQSTPKYTAGGLFFNNKLKHSAEVSKISSIQYNQYDNSNYNSVSSRVTDILMQQQSPPPLQSNPLYIPLSQTQKNPQQNLITPNAKKSSSSHIKQGKNSTSSKNIQNNNSLSKDYQNSSSQQGQSSIRMNTLNSPVSPIVQLSNFKNNQNVLIDYSSISTPNHMISLFATQTNSTPDLKGQGRVFHHQKGSSQSSRFNVITEQPQSTNRMIPSSISNRESSISKIPASILSPQSNSSTILKKRKNVTLDLRDQQDQIQTLKSQSPNQIGSTTNLNSSRKTNKTDSNQILSVQQQNKSLSPEVNKKQTSQWWKDVDVIDLQNGESVQVIKINNETKARLYRWLVDITLIKDEFDAKNIDRLAKFGKNGALFADLLNRITGKTNPLFNGIFRGAQNHSQINVNFNKAFTFMRQQQKLNPRYLWCVDYLKDGNPHIFWGLVDDLWHWSHQKISPFDNRYKDNQARLQGESVKIEKASFQRENKEYSYDKICFNQEAQKQKKLEDNYSILKANKLSQSQQSLQNSLSPNNYQNILSSSKSNLLGNQSQSMINHSISMRQYPQIVPQQNIQNQQTQQTLKRQTSPSGNNFEIDNLRDQSHLTFPITQQNQSFNQTQRARSPLKTPQVQMPSNSYKEQSDYRKLIVETANKRSPSPPNLKGNQISSIKHPSSQTTARFKTDQGALSNQKNAEAFGQHHFTQPSIGFAQQSEFQLSEERFYNPQQDILNKSQNQLSIVRANSPSYFSPNQTITNKNLNSPPSQNQIGGLSRVSSQKEFFGSSRNYVDSLRQSETKRIYSPTRQGQQIISGGGNIIDRNLEKICKHWLEELDYSERDQQFFTKDDTRFLFQDEARNGLFFKSLLFKIGMWYPPQNRKGLIKKPQSIEECRLNLSLIFDMLKAHRVEIPDKYSNYELLLSGSINAFWNIVYAIKKHLYGADSDSYEQNIFKILPYSEAELGQLENSLTQWLSNEIFQAKIENLFTQFSENLRNGLFWVELVEIITKRKVKNVNYQPKEKLHFYNNITNALAPLKTYKNFGQGFTYKEEKLALLNKQVILGLLEDLRRYHDGQPARQEPHYFKDGPYFGYRKVIQNHSNHRLTVLEDELDSHRLNTMSSPHNHTSSKTNLSTLNQEQNKSVQQGNQSKMLNQSKSIKVLNSKELEADHTNTNRGNTSKRNQKGNVGESASVQSDLQSSFRRRPSNLSNYTADQVKQQLNNSGYQQATQEKTQIQQNLSPSNFQTQQDIDDNNVIFNSNGKMSKLFKKFVSPIKLNSSNRMNYDTSFDTLQKMSSFLPEQKQEQRSLNDSQNRSGDFSCLRDLQSPKKPGLNQTYLSSSIYQCSEGELFNWLCLLGFEDFVTKVDFDQPFIEELKDGIFIANLTQILEEKQISGLIMEPKKMSCCIQNIRKAFNLIRNKRDVDFALVQHESKFFEAERNYIFALLNNLKYAYRQKTQYYQNFNKSQSRFLLNHNMTMSIPKKAEDLFYSKKEKENYILNKTEWDKSIVRPIKAQI